MLTQVISSLALASNVPAKGKKSAADFTPYRDSVCLPMIFLLALC